MQNKEVVTIFDNLQMFSVQPGGWFLSIATCKLLELKPDPVSLLVVPTVILITSVEKPVVDFILDGIICSCPCLIIIFLGDVVTSRLGGGTLTQLVNCLTSLDLCVTLCCKIADCIC